MQTIYQYDRTTSTQASAIRSQMMLDARLVGRYQLHHKFLPVNMLIIYHPTGLSLMNIQFSLLHKLPPMQLQAKLLR